MTIKAGHIPWDPSQEPRLEIGGRKWSCSGMQICFRGFDQWVPLLYPSLREVANGRHTLLESTRSGDRWGVRRQLVTSHGEESLEDGCRDRESAHANSSSQSAWEIPAGASQPKSLLLLETLAANHVPAFEILAAIFGDLVRISEADTSATPGYAAVC